MRGGFVAFLTCILYIVSFTGNAFAAHSSSPEFVECADTTWVVQAVGDASGTGVAVHNSISALMDAHDTSKYCFEVVTNAQVGTTHTGTLAAILTGLDNTSCRVPVNCVHPRGSNIYQVFGNPVSVNDGVQVCAAGTFFDDNGKTITANTCWTTP